MSRALASMVALRLDGHDPAVCAAWIDSADRICGRPAVAPWLCKRHETVARRKAERWVERDREKQAQYAARQESMRPAREARLAVVQAEIDRLDPPRGPFDHGLVNIPLAKRMPSDARIQRMAQLIRERDDLHRALGDTR